MDVAVHIGTLLAVLLYFWRDLWSMIIGCWRFSKGRRDPGARLAVMVILGTLPIIGAGVMLKDHMDGFRTLEVIGWTTLGFGLLLGLVDRLCMTVKRMEHIGVLDTLIIGLFQVLALIPGTSRSGITMTAARLLGFERSDSARFSMLLSIPTIVAAGTLVGLDLYEAGDWAVTESAGIAAALAFLSALIAIALMMAWLRTAGFGIFVVYRVILGTALLLIAYGILPLPTLI